MRQVIQGLIEVEGEARSIVQSARQGAEGLLSDAGNHARNLAEQAPRLVRNEAAHTIQTAVEAAEREKEHRLEKARAEIQSQVRMDETLRGRLVDAVVRWVCGQA